MLAFFVSSVYTGLCFIQSFVYTGHTVSVSVYIVYMKTLCSKDHLSFGLNNIHVQSSLYIIGTLERAPENVAFMDRLKLYTL